MYKMAAVRKIKFTAGSGGGDRAEEWKATIFGVYVDAKEKSKQTVF